MAFFKSLKNTFNSVYIGGVLSLYKTIKLKSYQLYWNLLSLVTLPISKTNSNVCIASGTYNIGRLIRIYYANESKLYMWTGYTWIYVGSMPASYTPSAQRRGILVPLAGLRLYLITCSAGSSENNKVYYLNTQNNTWTDVSNIWNTSLTPYNMYNTVCVCKNSTIYTFGGGATVNHKKIYSFSQSDWTYLGELPKDFFEGSNTAGFFGATAIDHKDVIHVIGYCESEGLIYDCKMDNWSNPTLITIGHGSGYDNYPQGSFEDANEVLYMYTTRYMYRFNDDNNTWEKTDSNNIGQYTRDSIVLQNKNTLHDGDVYRMSGSNMYRATVSYKLELEDQSDDI